MCGIIGICAPNASRLIRKANDIIAHRGPDSEGIFEHQQIALGHQRLSIQDLSANGHQPMFSADGNYVMIFNGEIYNHMEVRNKIASKYPFRSTSDSETLLYGFIEYGKDILNQLNGIFAFAIYNIQTQKLFIARDQMGIKPLYYYQKNNEFLFGSEIKSFLTVPGFDKTLDYSALVNYLHFLYSPDVKTPFKYVKKLRPGHYIELDVRQPQNFKTTKFYEIPFTGKITPQSEEEAIEALDKHLTNAVERQLLSDVPVGFFLSGGLDSSALVAMTRKLRPDQKIRCYTIDAQAQDRSGNDDEKDLPYAIKVAKHLNVDLEIVKADVDILRDFDKMIWHLDEPQADPAPLNVLNISQQAKQDGYSVLIGGAGGDDLFSGYRRHQAIAMEKYLKLIPSPLGKLIKSTTKGLNTQNALARRIRKLSAQLGKTTTDRLAGYYEWLPPDRNFGLFDTDIRAAMNGHQPGDILKTALQNNIPNEQNLLNQMLYWDLKFFLTDHNLNYTDKMSMATGVEVRVPFLDLDLVDYSTTLPINLKMKGTTPKYILKKVMEKYLPHDVIYRPKVGFGAPVRRWVLHDLDEMIQDYLSESRIAQRGIFNPKRVHQLINDNKKGAIDASYTVFSLLAIESWMRQFVDS